MPAWWRSGLRARRMRIPSGCSAIKPTGAFRPTGALVPEAAGARRTFPAISRRIRATRAAPRIWRSSDTCAASKSFTAGAAAPSCFACRSNRVFDEAHQLADAGHARISGRWLFP